MNLKLTAYKLILILTIPLALLFVGHTQVAAAKLYFSPATQSIVAGCRTRINLMIDTQGKFSNAADIEITFDPNKLEILDSNSSVSGVQIETGQAYESYFGDEVNNATGRIRLAAGSFIRTFKGISKFASIELRSKGTATTAQLNIKFDGAGNTIDSNIAESATSNDILTSVTNAKFTMTTGSCVADQQAPVIVYENIQDGQVFVPAKENVVVKVSDSVSGIDLSSVIININGQQFKSGDNGVIVTGTPASYQFEISGNAHPGFKVDFVSTITTKATDKAGNSQESTITFNKANSPQIDFVSPTSGQLNLPKETDIIITISDAETGVDVSSVKIVLNGKVYTHADPAVSYTGDPSEYTFTLVGTKHTGLISDVLNTVRVYASDKAGNDSTNMITLNSSPLKDTIKPIIQLLQPSSFETFDPTKPILMKLYDSESGVSLNSLEVYINDRLFTISEPNVSYYGNELAYTVTINNYQELITERITSFRIAVMDNAANFQTFILGDQLCVEYPDVTLQSGNVCLGVIVPIWDDSILSSLIRINTQLSQGSISGSTAITLLFGILLLKLPWLSLASLPFVLGSLFRTVIGKRNSSWGMVIDHETYRHLMGIKVKLLTGNDVLMNTYTDINGRYRFQVKAGVYNVVINHSLYQYFNQQVEVKADNQIVALNIPLNRKYAYQVNIIKYYFHRSLRYLQNTIEILIPLIYLLGTYYAIQGVIEKPNAGTMAILATYFFALVLFLIINKARHQNSYIKDNVTGRRLRGVSLKVYNKTGELVECLMTNSMGKFRLHLPAGEYQVAVAKLGYRLAELRGHKYSDLGSQRLQVIEYNKKDSIVFNMDPTVRDGINS